MDNKTLPILLKNQKLPLIGNGKVASHKADVLKKNNIAFTQIKEHFKKKHLKGYFIIVDATGNPQVAKKLLSYKKKHNVLLNIANLPQQSDFYFMALTKNAPLQIAVSTNGISPTVAQHFRDRCQKIIPQNIDLYLKKKKKERKQKLIDVEKTKHELQAKVYLVGCGIGDVELLTIKALRVIQSVDVVLIDHLISEEIKAIIPNTTKQVFVGKEQGYHSKSQEEINALILKYVKKNKSVARLKSGDPFVFGRGSEELLALHKHNIITEVIPGISSAISAPLLANIPITARGYASSFSVVSAHLKGNKINLAWIELLQKKEHTVVVLMGLSRIKEIMHEAKRQQIAMDKPCAIISNASRPNQKVILTTLKKLEKKSKDAQKPAILVFGECINFTKNL